MSFFYLLTAIWLWSLVPLATKYANDSFNVGFIGFTRVAVATGIFGLLYRAQLRSIRALATTSSPIPGPRWMTPLIWTVLAGLGIGSDQLLYTFGLKYTTASAATLIVSTDGVLLALLGVLLLKERMSWMKAAAGLASLTGLVLVNWSGQDLRALAQSDFFLGNLAVLGAAFCWACYGLGQRVLATRPGEGLFHIFLVACAVTGGMALLQPPLVAPITWTAALALAILAFLGTGLSYILLAKALRKLEAATVGLTSCTLPLFTMVEAHFIMGEEISGYLVGGALCVITAVLLIVRHQRVVGRD
jgi:drug/metabolite transporter (DMT)-like permease